MVTIRPEREVDEAARVSNWLDAAYGPIRFKKPSHRLREGREPAAGLSFVAVMDGRAVGTVRLWPVEAGAGRPALLLGPLAVDRRYRKRGVGSALMQRALRDVGKRGHHAGAAGWGPSLLRPVWLLRREDRQVVAAWPLSSSIGCWGANSSLARSMAPVA